MALEIVCGCIMRDSSISLGAQWRTENADSDYVSAGNTGRPVGVGSSVSTTDDSNLNYDRGDMTSLVFKGVHDLELTYKQFGFFTRFSMTSPWKTMMSTTATFPMAMSAANRSTMTISVT